MNQTTELWKIIYRDARDAKLCRDRQRKNLLRGDSAGLSEAARDSSQAMTWETAMLIGLRRLAQVKALEGEVAAVFRLHEHAAAKWLRDEEGADEEMTSVRLQLVEVCLASVPSGQKLSVRV